MTLRIPDAKETNTLSISECRKILNDYTSNDERIMELREAAECVAAVWMSVFEHGTIEHQDEGDNLLPRLNQRAS